MPPRKLSCPESEVTKLKLLWRNSLSEPQRDYWREQFASPRSQPALRRDLLERHGINLQYNTQLARFRKWVQEEDAMAEEDQRAAADREELEKLGLSDEELRHEILQRVKQRALTRGDLKLALKAIAADVQVAALQFGREKFQAGLRTKLEAGLDEVADAFKANPQALELYQQASALVSPKSK